MMMVDEGKENEAGQQHQQHHHHHHQQEEASGMWRWLAVEAEDLESGRQHTDTETDFDALVAQHRRGDSSRARFTEDPQSEKLIDQIKDLKLRLGRDQGPPASSIVGTNTLDPSPQITDALASLRYRIRSLIAEKTALLQMPILVREESAANIRNASMERLRCVTKGTASLCNSERRAIKGLTADYQRLQQMRDDHRLMGQALDERIASLEEEIHQHTSGSPEHQISQAERECARQAKVANATNRHLMNALKKFLLAHFPAPTADDIHHASRKSKAASSAKAKKTIKDFFPKHVHSDNDDDDDDDDDEEERDERDGVVSSAARRSREKAGAATDEHLPLQTVLEELMNLCVSRPSNPYLVLDSARHWMPYIEMLQRAGIIRTHPRYPDQVKLVEFHL